MLLLSHVVSTLVLLKFCAGFAVWTLVWILELYCPQWYRKDVWIFQAVTKMIQEAYTYVEKTPSMDVKLKLIDTLRTVTAGKVWEGERERECGCVHACIFVSVCMSSEWVCVYDVHATR